MKRVRVKLLERYGSSRPGEIVSLPDHVAIELVANHEANWVDESDLSACPPAGRRACRHLPTATACLRADLSACRHAQAGTHRQAGQAGAQAGKALDAPPKDRMMRPHSAKRKNRNGPF